MLNKLEEQLQKILDTCAIHHKRLEIAYQNIEHLFPIDQNIYYALTDTEMAYVDQYIFRFSKYQDSIGGKLLKQILTLEGEYSDSMSFKDIFNKAEKLGFAEDWDRWFEVRQIRNDIAHDYPVISTEAVQSLNAIIENYSFLVDAHTRCISFLSKKATVTAGTVKVGSEK